jgi:hypothetical protein
MPTPWKPLGLSALNRIFLATPPTGIVVTPTSSSTMTVSWTRNPIALSYRVYRNGLLAATPTVYTFNDSGLAFSTTYSYVVSSVGSTGEGPPSAVFQGTTLAVDTIPPTVPVISAASSGQTSIVISLVTASTDVGSGLKEYALEESTNGTTGWTEIGRSLVLFPFTRTGLTASTTRYYRARAFDNATPTPNSSAYSTTASATTQSSVSAPVWQSGQVDILLVVGTAADVDIASYVTGESAIDLLSGSVPGLSYSSTTMRLSGTPTTVNQSPGYDVQFRALNANDTALFNDWNTRSSGALMRTRFETDGEVLDYRLLDSKASNITRDTTRGVYGRGSLKIAILNVDGSNSGNWFRHLNDAWGLYTGSGGQAGGVANRTNQGFDEGTVFEVSYLMYIPAALRDNIFPNGAGWKSSIISHDHSSNQSFEVVVQNTLQRGFVHGYQTNNPSHPNYLWSLNSNNPCSSSDYRWQPEIDRGLNPLTGNSPVTGLPWTPCEQTWARYGGTYSRTVAGYPNSVGAGRVWTEWAAREAGPNPIGPLLYPADDWIAIKQRITMNSYTAYTNRIQTYVQRRFHSNWVLVADIQNAQLPTSDNGGGFNIRYNTLWLTPFHTNKTSGVGFDTAIWYDGVICKLGADSIPPLAVWP